LGELTHRLAFDLSLYVVVGPDCVRAGSIMDVADAAVAGGATAIQLRFKDAALTKVVDTGRELRLRLQASGVPLIVNDNAEAAVEIDAQGLHIGQDDIPPSEARAIIGPERILGLSITDAAQLDSIDSAVVDYLGVGPVFHTGTKADAAPPMGLGTLTAIAESTRLPIVAIGGIDASNGEAVIRAGADGIAVVSAVCSASDPRQAAQLLARAVRAGRRPRHDAAHG
jgi:thiamine-phosphate pyrophosphorylase